MSSLVLATSSRCRRERSQAPSTIRNSCCSWRLGKRWTRISANFSPARIGYAADAKPILSVLSIGRVAVCAPEVRFLPPFAGTRRRRRLRFRGIEIRERPVYIQTRTRRGIRIRSLCRDARHRRPAEHRPGDAADQDCSDQSDPYGRLMAFGDGQGLGILLRRRRHRHRTQGVAAKIEVGKPFAHRLRTIRPIPAKPCGQCLPLPAGKSNGTTRRHSSARAPR